MTDELEVLAVVGARLEAAAIPYMVTGSLAANYYAVPRMTRDIWMVEFARGVSDARIQHRLLAALGRNRPFRRFKDALDDPGVRERWFALRQARLREAARAWLAEHEIEPTTRPPERSA